MLFLCQLRWSWGIFFFFHSVNVLYYIAIHMLNHPCIPRINPTSSLFFLKDSIHLYFETREGREKEGEKQLHKKETSISCFAHAPNWWFGLQPRHVPWSGIKPATFCFTGWPSTLWATPVRGVMVCTSLTMWLNSFC